MDRQDIEYLDNCPVVKHSYPLKKCLYFCTFCEKGNKDIPKGFEVCKSCHGSGHYFEFDHLKRKSWKPCRSCDGEGTITWIQKILR